MQLTTNFKLSEFICGAEPTGMQLLNVKLLAGELQKLRNAIGRSITVVSGYCATNEDAGASATHTNGIGACIRSSGMTAEQLGQKALQLMQAGQMVKGNIVVYNDRVHVDIRGTLNYIDKRTQTAPPVQSTPAPSPGGSPSTGGQEAPWYLSGATPYFLLGSIIAIAYLAYSQQSKT